MEISKGLFHKTIKFSPEELGELISLPKTLSYEVFKKLGINFEKLDIKIKEE